MPRKLSGSPRPPYSYDLPVSCLATSYKLNFFFVGGLYISLSLLAFKCRLFQLKSIKERIKVRWFELDFLIVLVLWGFPVISRCVYKQNHFVQHFQSVSPLLIGFVQNSNGSILSRHSNLLRFSDAARVVVEMICFIMELILFFFPLEA